MQQEEVRCLAMYLDMSEKDLRKIIELLRNKNPEYVKEAIINCSDRYCDNYQEIDAAIIILNDLKKLCETH